jgi:hypothetical protein
MLANKLKIVLILPKLRKKLSLVTAEKGPEKRAAQIPKRVGLI